MSSSTSDLVLLPEGALPVVSVIIPTYNRWPWIKEAVDSVLTLDYRQFELIVVDDGSTDGTAERFSEFGSQLRLIQQPQRGVSAARNRGAAAARGRYLAFLDSDDLWLPKKLGIQVAFMEAHPEVQICQTDEIWIRNGRRVNPKLKHKKPSGDIFRRSLELCLVSPSAVMMKRELFDRFGGFDENLPVCEDYDLWLRIGAEYSVPLIPDALVVKRGGHGDQLSRSFSSMDWYRVRSLQKLLRTDLSGEKRRWAIETLRRKISILSQGAHKRGKTEEAVGYQSVLNEFIKEPVNVGDANSRLCGRQGLPPADRSAMAGLE